MKKYLLFVGIVLMLSLTTAGNFGYNYLENPNSFFGEVEFDGGWLDGGCTIEDGEVHCQKGFFYNLTSVDVTKQNMTILDNLEIDGNITADYFLGQWNGSSDYLLTSNWNATNTSYSPHEDGTASGQMAFWDTAAGKWVKTETSELFWDDTNKRLGVGTATPEKKLSLGAGGQIKFHNEIGDKIYFYGAIYGMGISNNELRTWVNTVNDFFTWGYGGRTGTPWMSLINGRLGIGTQTPDTKLQVVGSFKSGDDNTNYLSINETGTMSFTGSAGIVGLSSLGIGTTEPSYPLEVRGNGTGNVSIWAWSNISATGFITRTSIFDKTKNVWDYIKDADYFKINNEIEHKNFYGYAGEFEVTDYSRPVTENRCFQETRLENYTYTEEVCEYEKILLSNNYEYICENVSEQKERNIQNCSMQEQCNYIQKEGEEYFEKVCEIVEVCTDKFFEVCEDEITYPHKKIEEGVELGMEIDVLRQAVYELNERLKVLEAI